MSSTVNSSSSSSVQTSKIPDSFYRDVRDTHHLSRYTFSIEPSKELKELYVLKATVSKHVEMRVDQLASRLLGQPQSKERWEQPEEVQKIEVMDKNRTLVELFPNKLDVIVHYFEQAKAATLIYLSNTLTIKV